MSHCGSRAVLCASASSEGGDPREGGLPQASERPTFLRSSQEVVQVYPLPNAFSRRTCKCLITLWSPIVPERLISPLLIPFPVPLSSRAQRPWAGVREGLKGIHALWHVLLPSQLYPAASKEHKVSASGP